MLPKSLPVLRQITKWRRRDPDKVAEDRRRAGPPGLMAGGGGAVCVGCAPGPRLAAGDNPKGSHFGTHNGNTWISSFQWIDFREQVPPGNFRFLLHLLGTRLQRGLLPRPAYFLLPAPPLAPPPHFRPLLPTSDPSSQSALRPRPSPPPPRSIQLLDCRRCTPTGGRQGAGFERGFPRRPLGRDRRGAGRAGGRADSRPRAGGRLRRRVGSRSAGRPRPHQR